MAGPSQIRYLVNLPVEILTIICHFVLEQDTAPPRPRKPRDSSPTISVPWHSGPHSLVKFASTCKHVHAVATPVLYREINPNHGLASAEYFVEGDCKSLFRNLVSCPDLRRLIRHMNIRLIHHYPHGLLDWDSYYDFRNACAPLRRVSLWDTDCLEEPENDAATRLNYLYQRAEATRDRLLQDLFSLHGLTPAWLKTILPIALLCIATQLRTPRIILDRHIQRQVNLLQHIPVDQGTDLVICPHLERLTFDGSFELDSQGREPSSHRASSPVNWNPEVLLLVAAMPSFRFLELRRFTRPRGDFESILLLYSALKRLCIFMDDSELTWNVQRVVRRGLDPVHPRKVVSYFNDQSRGMLAAELLHNISQIPSAISLQSLCLYGCHEYHNYTRAPSHRWRIDRGLFGLISHIGGFADLRVLAVDYRIVWPLDSGVLTTLIEECALLKGFMLYYADGLLPEDLVKFAEDVSHGKFPNLKIVKLVSGPSPKGTREPKRRKLWKDTNYQPLQAVVVASVQQLFEASGVRLVVQDKPDDDLDSEYEAFERQVGWWP
ncbi:hypothetical protein QBC40DRAFT_322795 [Triangularia verruculosa]|uniref:Uncharacterized protein n=1 Tax=Triangularia verruculosa TaxID=2587418 RepID=A0AAN6XK46_9PEZI|nr:hypothetical protein QBC40DRAFT_322795 [Triangularia verruculosa]